LPFQTRRLLWTCGVIVTVVLAAAGLANAATPPAGSIGSANPTVTWVGQFYAVGTNADANSCQPQAMDPINLTCDHFQLNVEDAGPVTVTITWPAPDDDFDLFVFDSSNNLVASSADIGTTSETATFTAAPGLYEVRVAPFFVTASGYDGTATFDGGGNGGGNGNGGGQVDPPISVSDALVGEGDAFGTTNAVFTVSMAWSTLSPVTVDYVTLDDSASAGSDYVAQTGTVVFAPGQTRATIAVPVLGDNVDEGTERFQVRLALPQPALVVAKLDDFQGFGTIRESDRSRRFSGTGRVGLLNPGTFSLYLSEYRRCSWWCSRFAYADSTFRFSSTRLDPITVDDTGRSVHVTGTGRKNGTSVSFTLDVSDHGPGGTLDTFLLVLGDGTRVTGPVTNGDISYTSR
jgi:hypothetical protein